MKLKILFTTLILGGATQALGGVQGSVYVPTDAKNFRVEKVDKKIQRASKGHTQCEVDDRNVQTCHKFAPTPAKHVLLVTVGFESGEEVAPDFTLGEASFPANLSQVNIALPITSSTHAEKKSIQLAVHKTTKTKEIDYNRSSFCPGYDISHDGNSTNESCTEKIVYRAISSQPAKIITISLTDN